MSPADFYLVRGLGRESRHWGEFSKELKRQKYCNEIHFLELPGAGDYFELSSPATIKGIAQFLKAHLVGVDDRPKVLFAVSLGAMVSIELLYQIQPFFDHAFLMNTSFASLSPVYHRLQVNALKQFYSISRAQSLQARELQVLKMISQSPEKWGELSQLWATYAQERPMNLLNILKQLSAAAFYKIPSNPPEVEITALRSLGDKMVSPQCSVDFANHWGLELMTHPTAGHDICIDDPNWVFDQFQSIFRKK